MSMHMKPFDHDELLKLDGDVPFVRSVPYGIQHILAMFVANLAPIMIIAGAAGLDDVSTGGMIQAAMLIAGIGTLIQLFPIGRLGSGLPIVMGISFTFVTVLAGVVATYGMGAAMGAIIVGGCIEGVLGLFARYWRKLITPIVAAVVVTSIGFSLLSVGATSFGGGSGAVDFGSPRNLLLGTVSLVACLAFQCLVKGKQKHLFVLFGLVVGYIVAKHVLKMNLLNILGSITGGMTSTPALGTLIHVAGTSNVASAYAATYPIALIAVVLVSQLLVRLF